MTLVRGRNRNGFFGHFLVKWSGKMGYIAKFVYDIGTRAESKWLFWSLFGHFLRNVGAYGRKSAAFWADVG
jgi:hypothetical protein